MRSRFVAFFRCTATRTQAMVSIRCLNLNSPTSATTTVYSSLQVTFRPTSLALLPSCPAPVATDHHHRRHHLHHRLTIVIVVVRFPGWSLSSSSVGAAVSHHNRQGTLPPVDLSHLSSSTSSSSSILSLILLQLLLL